MAIPAASVLKFLNLANELGLSPLIYREGGNFVIKYHYPDRYRNEQIAIDQESSEDLSGHDYNCFYSELRYLVDKYNEKQKDSEEEERQEVLNRLTDREKELLGLT